MRKQRRHIAIRISFKLLQSGDLDSSVLNGNILIRLPSADIQGIPLAFTNANIDLLTDGKLAPHAARLADAGI